MSARDRILARIRAKQEKPAVPSEGEHGAVDSRIAARRPNARPRVGNGLDALFRERARGLATTVSEAESLTAVPAAVAEYLRLENLPQAIVCWPEFGSLDWRGAGIDAEARAARDGDPVGVTGAFCAIAETGTILLLSGGTTPATVSLLPETHIAIVRADSIVPGMEEAWARLRMEHVSLPRAVNFVSGPSRTADIEQTVTLGAHGPYRVHIVLV